MHWVHASAFFVLLGTGLVLYVPRLSTLVARRPLIKDIHVYTAVAWIVLLALVVVLGDRRGLRQTLATSICSTRTTGSGFAGNRGRRAASTPGRRCTPRWSQASRCSSRSPGFLLWLGERDTRFRWASTILLHDGLMYASLVLLAGSPLPGADLPGDPPRAARNHLRLGTSRLGARASPKVDRA